MKKIFFVFFVICINISCNSKNAKIVSNANPRNSLRDTLYLKTDSMIILESLYLNLDSIKVGDTFTSKDNQFGYYRLLFSSSEEMQSVYAEKINIIGDGKVELYQRIKLSPELFGERPEASSYEFIGWETSEIVKIKLDSLIFRINLTDIFKRKH
jgi:hypothetical protein